MKVIEGGRVAGALQVCKISFWLLYLNIFCYFSISHVQLTLCGSYLCSHPVQPTQLPQWKNIRASLLSLRASVIKRSTLGGIFVYVQYGKLVHVGSCIIHPPRSIRKLPSAWLRWRWVFPYPRWKIIPSTIIERLFSSAWRLLFAGISPFLAVATSRWGILVGNFVDHTWITLFL